MKKDPIGEAKRARRREDRLGTEAQCVLCGERDPESLTRINRTLLEQHHVVARANDPDFTVVVCRNCHAILSAGQDTYGVPRNKPETVLHRMIAILRALGALFVQLGQWLMSQADQLVSLASALDARCKSWRTMPEAAA